MTRRITWTWEETVLAGWAAARHDWRGVNERTPVVRELSLLLQALPIHPVTERPDNFRSPGSVGRKINSLRAARPDYEGKGLRVIGMEADVVNGFLRNEAAMMQEASEILAKYNQPGAN
ncbi:hypothetical protein [Micrococcus sp.]|uniref:hypothetical protein n=1 Tax=Micrococcus sp. TaxID=1271 RepID=UPI0026DD6CB6|nr:hypothetical protein [Micrococcus sp.]MDO4239358.1 hypothetical protein [Micrococcus sp.]